MGNKTFLVILKNKRRGQQTPALLKSHVEYLKSLHRQGKLPFCGPLLDNDRGVWILRVSSESEAIQAIEQDPFVKERYYQDYEFNEMQEANDGNNWLMEDTQTVSNMRT